MTGTRSRLPPARAAARRRAGIRVLSSSPPHPGPTAGRTPLVRPLSSGLLVAALLFGTAGASITLLYRKACEVHRAEVHAGLRRAAVAAATVIDGDLHRTFVDPAQENSVEYRRAVAPLGRFQSAVDGVRFVYTVIEQSGRVHFVLDPTPPGDHDGDGVDDHCCLMQVYEHADPAMLAALREGRATTTDRPCTDAWGTFLSGYAPFYDSAGKQVGIVGVDITLGEYERRLVSMRRTAVWGLLPATLVSLAAGSVVFMLRRAKLRAERLRQSSVAELRASEEYHRRIFESVTDGLLIFDVDGRIVEANPAACRMHGHDRQELIGRLGPDIIHPDSHAAFHRFRAMLRAADEFHTEAQDVRRDGTAFDIEVRGKVLEFRGQQHLLAVVRDITARKNAERDLERARATAESASRAKSDFLARMSHEIRTPLTAILGFAEALNDAGISEGERRDAARTILRNGQHLLRIIDDILDISRIESGRMEIEALPSPLIPLVSDVESLMRARAQARGLTFTVEYAGAVPPQVRTDPTRLRQILINLLGNAVKFTSSGGVTLTIDLVDGCEAVADPAPPQLRFRVRDTGIGMTRDQLARAFEPFAQGDQTMTRRYGGTGLGLAISRRLAEHLGGRLNVESCPDVGTTCELLIPTGPLDGVTLVHPECGEATLAAGLGSPPSAPRTLPNCRLLVAEDGVDNQRLIACVLRRAGAEVTVVENGAQAVASALQARATGHPFDVVLLDMQMPVLDGYAAARQLRHHGYRGPIVALTAHAMAGDREQCLRAGCDDYVTKPIDRRTFLDTLARHLAGAPVGHA